MYRPEDEHHLPARTTGFVRFDDRGNAVWQTFESAQSDTGVIRALDCAHLQIADDACSGIRQAATNFESGCDPYRRDALGKGTARRSPADMRALSDEILRKRAESAARLK